ncbi:MULTISPECIES: hypothetical protein [Cupriavidus]
MKLSATQSGWTRPTIVKLTAALGLAVAIFGLSIAQASGAEDHHTGPQGRGENHGYRHAANHQGYRGDEHRGYHHGYGNGYVYAPPPVAYVPQPAPGISLFFPLQFR